MAASWDESFPTMITRLRRDAGLTQEQLADRSGLSVRAISSIECGDRHPRRYTVERIAQALQVSGPVHATLVAGADGGRRRPPGPPVLPSAPPPGPLLGRAAELGDLRTHLAGSGPAVLAFAGEPGMGKSRLLAEAVAMASEWGLPVFASVARRGDRGYAPVDAALADHITRTPPGVLAHRLRDCAGLDLLLPELTGRVRRLPSSAPAQAQRLGYDAAVRYLDAVAGHGRVAIVLDDAQWAAPDGVDLLSHLVARVRADVRVVVGYRPAEVVAGGGVARYAQELDRLGQVRTRILRPLPADAAAALVDATGALSVSARATVVRRAAGVPLFLVGLTRAELEQTGEKVPWHLRLAVGQELAALPKPVVGLLTKMALIATTVAAERLIADDLPADQLLDYLGVALQVGILDETRRGFRFRYPLVREVIREGIGPGRRTLWRSLSAPPDRSPE